MLAKNELFFFFLSLYSTLFLTLNSLFSLFFFGSLSL